jgi:hypothetical protein
MLDLGRTDHSIFSNPGVTPVMGIGGYSQPILQTLNIFLLGHETILSGGS